jgi:hypothetical protein
MKKNALMPARLPDKFVTVVHSCFSSCAIVDTICPMTLSGDACVSSALKMLDAASRRVRAPSLFLH